MRGSWLRASTGSARVAKKRGGEHSRRQRSAKACSIARSARVLYLYCTGTVPVVPVSGYLTIRNIRRLFYGIWIYLDHPHQLSVSTRWQNGHYPVNPDGAGASRIHALRDNSRRDGAETGVVMPCRSGGSALPLNDISFRPRHMCAYFACMLERNSEIPYWGVAFS